MKICLIDADSTIPNLALMKLSAFHKSLGDEVELHAAGLPYYLNKKKSYFFAPLGYDKYYCSVVFSGNKRYILGADITFGGTGYNLTTSLSTEVENLLPDYSIYPGNNISYGFITRGCIRNCHFCVVPKKEGMIKQVSTIDKIVRHKKTKFLDNNILALPNHKEILQELVSRQVRCQFNQGLDIRLLDSENSLLLSKMNYLGEYIFAFDDWSYQAIISKQLRLLHWRKLYQLKFFVYCHPSMQISNIVKRIEFLKENKCLPYLMRHIDCWKSEFSDFYVDIAAYCNQPALFKKLSFENFLEKRHTKTQRIENSKNLWNFK